MCDEILRQAVEGVSDIITTPGEINTDFNDIKAIMEGAGPALMGIGVADGDNRAREAAALAVNSPLLDVSINGAKGILFVVAGSDDLGILEVQEAAKVVSESVDKGAKVIFGIMRDEKLKKGQIRIIVIATGFPDVTADGNSPERSLFAQPLIKAEVEPSRGMIFNEVQSKTGILGNKRSEPEEIRETVLPVIDETPITRREEPIVTATPKQREEKPLQPVAEDEDEAWGAIPSFLRRHKK